jgi:hypothetical protein
MLFFFPLGAVGDFFDAFAGFFAEVAAVLEEVAGSFVLVAGFDACFVLEPAESGAWVDGSSYLFPSNGVAARSAQSSPANKRAGIIANMEEKEERII